MNQVFWIAVAGAIAVAIIAVCFPQGLGLAAQVCGFFSAVLLTLPFLRDNRYKKLEARLRRIRSGKGGVEAVKRAAINHVNVRLQTWRFEDIRDAYSGIVFLTLSFLAGSLNELLRLLGDGA